MYVRILYQYDKIIVSFIGVGASTAKGGRENVGTVKAGRRSHLRPPRYGTTKALRT